MRASQRGTNLTLELSPTETRALRGALAEVCFGFSVSDFDRVIGCNKQEARALFTRLDSLDLEQNDRIVLGINELRAIKNAHLETLNTLGADEFQTRVGVSFDEGERIGRELDGALGLAGGSPLAP
jgi:hypothetical protein